MIAMSNCLVLVWLQNQTADSGQERHLSATFRLLEEPVLSEKKLLRIKNCFERYGFESKGHMYKAVWEHNVPAVKIGGRWWINVDRADRWLDKQADRHVAGKKRRVA